MQLLAENCNFDKINAINVEFSKKCNSEIAICGNKCNSEKEIFEKCDSKIAIFQKCNSEIVIFQKCNSKIAIFNKMRFWNCNFQQNAIMKL